MSCEKVRSRGGGEEGGGEKGRRGGQEEGRRGGGEEGRRVEKRGKRAVRE